MRFTALQAARLTNASRAQLDAWSCAGLVAPASTYSVRDLVAARLVAALLDAGLSLGRIRPALDHIVEHDDALEQFRLVTDGETVRPCRTDAEVIDALRDRPLAVVVTAAPFVAATESAIAAFDAERRGFVDVLQAG